MKKIFLFLFVLGIVNNLLAQNIGVGTTTPNASAQLDITSTNKGLLLPRMTSANRTAIASPANGLIVFDSTTNRLYQYQDGIWRYLLNNTYWAQSTARNWVYNGTDSVGIGNSAPTQRLDVNGNIRVRDDLLADGRVVATGIVAGSNLQTPGNVIAAGNLTAAGTSSLMGDVTTNGDMIINNTGATIQLKNGSNVNKGFFQIAGDDVRFGTNSGNNLGNVIVRMNGNNRFTFTDEGRFTISADNTPTLHFYSGGVPQASLQVQGQDLAINAPSNKVRINNQIYADDANNRVGIGTSTPSERLHVSGNTYISGTLTSNGRSYFNQTVNVSDTLFAPGGLSGDFVKANRGSFGGINTRATLGYLAVGYDVLANGEGSCIIADASAGFLNNTANKMLMRFENGYRLLTENDLSSGVFMENGDNSWSSVSDSTKKKNFLPADGNAFLKKIAGMRLGSWNYKAQDKSKRHYGPMAQEFFANFGNDAIGKIGSDTAIATADIDGVMMIAIQALEKRTTDQQYTIDALKKEMQDLKAIMLEQNKIVTALKNDNHVIAKKNE